jgi:hypothetical protein
MQKLNDLSRSLTALEPDGTLAVIEMSLSSWLVAGIVPGVERMKKLAVDESALLKLLHRWREEAEKAGRRIDPRASRARRPPRRCSRSSGSKKCVTRPTASKERRSKANRKEAGGDCHDAGPQASRRLTRRVRCALDTMQIGTQFTKPITLLGRADEVIE